MQGYNKYYPPDYDGSKSLNELAGRKQKGTVRFELPFDVYCLSCDKRITQGVRFNAVKTRRGNYYSSPIWLFAFKCHLCGGPIEIRTDPQNTAYVIEKGARRTVSDESAALAVERTAETTTEDNPLAKVEKEQAELNLQQTRNKKIADLYEANSRQWDDYDGQSQKLRGIFRQEKKKIEKRERDTRALQDKMSLDIPLVEETPQDSDKAGSALIQGKLSHAVEESLASASQRPVLSSHSKSSKRARAVIEGLVYQSSSFEFTPNVKRPARSSNRPLKSTNSSNTPTRPEPGLVGYTSD